MPRPAVAPPERYFDAALRLLAQHGVGGLTLAALGRELGVTSGSFYHHFGGWPAFVTALLAHWEAEQTGRILRLTRERTDPWERVSILKAHASAIPHEAEAAIRAWGRADAQVREVQRRVDELRAAGLREVIGGLGVPAADTARLATMGVALLVGMQQLRDRVDPDELNGVLDELEHAVVRHLPDGVRPADAGSER